MLSLSLSFMTPAAILSEGEEISRVAFIQSGSCTALVRVPRAPRFTQVSSYGNKCILRPFQHTIIILLLLASFPGSLILIYMCLFLCYLYSLVAHAQIKVTVGHLTAGDCIGEGMLRGNDRQPYTVISTSRLRVGWVTSTTLRGQGKVK